MRDVTLRRLPLSSGGRKKKKKQKKEKNEKKEKKEKTEETEVVSEGMAFLFPFAASTEPR